MRRAARRDANHAEIRAELRRRGYEVYDCGSVGSGYPDLHVAKGGRAVLVEVKTLGGTFTDAEAAFAASWPGPYIVAVTWRDVAAWFAEEAAR